MKTQVAERENCNCDRCRNEMVRMLQGDLQNALRQIDALKARNRKLEEKVLLTGTGTRDTVLAKQKFPKCMVIGHSMLRNVGAENAAMMAECFLGIKTEQLHRVIDKT